MLKFALIKAKITSNAKMKMLDNKKQVNSTYIICTSHKLVVY